jgi:energy-coupling factor transporter ATP-binding protein EcfA2
VQLRKLWLEDFKNLRDVEIDFEGSRQTTVLLGQNGSGKSNVIEALLMIFRDLHGERRPELGCRLEYTCNERTVAIDARRERRTWSVVVDGVRMPLKDFKAARAELLPRYVFAYYSGSSDRLERHAEDHQRRFYEELIADDPERDELPLRPLLYVRPEHSAFVLLAYREEFNPELAALLREQLSIERIESVLFVLKQPDWAKSGTVRRRSPGDRFWGAQGEVRTLVELLERDALAPLDGSTLVRPAFNKRSTREARRYLFLPDPGVLRAIADAYGSQRDFFKALESLYISDMLESVRIRVRLVDGPVITFPELSEGEKQLITVLGLLAFTSDQQSLFLLDEPDTHLNPRWSADFVTRVESVLRRTARESHVVIATHDPVIVRELEREEIRLLERDEQGTVRVVMPERTPRGLGVAGVLTGDFFGLPSTLDSDTQALLQERYELTVRQRALDDAERQRLWELTGQLSDLGFMQVVRDPLYSEYLRARHELSRDGDVDQRTLLARALAQAARETAIDEQP